MKTSNRPIRKRQHQSATALLLGRSERISHYPAFPHTAAGSSIPGSSFSSSSDVAILPNGILGECTLSHAASSSSTAATAAVPDHFASNPDIMSRAAAAAFDNSISRAGKWSVEEETFANRLIVDFESGLLSDCEDGCTLRSYLARKLNCAPMRISKKFAKLCIGKHVYNRKDTRSDASAVNSVTGKRSAQDMPVIKVGNKHRRNNNHSSNSSSNHSSKFSSSLSFVFPKYNSLESALLSDTSGSGSEDGSSSGSNNSSSNNSGSSSGRCLSPSPSFDSFHRALSPQQSDGFLSLLHPTQSAHEFSHFLMTTTTANAAACSAAATDDEADDTDDVTEDNDVAAAVVDSSSAAVAIGLDIDDLYADYSDGPLSSSTTATTTSTTTTSSSSTSTSSSNSSIAAGDNNISGCGHATAEAQEWSDVLEYFCGENYLPNGYVDSAEDIVASAAAAHQQQQQQLKLQLPICKIPSYSSLCL